ncbi:MAG: tetratricopeptide repeat protein [Nitrospinae bacterium]|nr:tetratricopeptide repeat protein [Nitrospinota bacterium]
MTAALLLAAVVYIYGGSLEYPLQFDDAVVIKENKEIRDIANWGALWDRDAPRFVILFSLAVNYHLGELSPVGYHIFNIAVHFLFCLAVFWLVHELLSTPAGQGAANAHQSLFAFGVALATAVHPLQTQGVVYIWQRATSIVALLYVVSLAAYLASARKEQQGAGGHGLLAFSMAAAVAAMFSKQNAITLPVAIALADYFFISGSVAALRARMARLAWFIPPLLIIPALTALGYNDEINHIGGRFHNMLSPFQYLITQFGVIVMYLRLLLIPVDQNLDYDIRPADSMFQVWPDFAILAALLLLGFALWRRSRIASFGILFFFLTMSVESSIFPLEDLAFEHRMYLPVVGLFMAGTAGIFEAARRISPRQGWKWIAASLAVYAVAMAAAAHERVEVWRTGETLWRDVVAKAPGKARGYNNLGAYYLHAGRNHEAERLLLGAVAIEPRNYYYVSHLALLYLKTGNEDRALAIAQRAKSLNPSDVNVRYVLGNIYLKKGMWSDAAKHYYVGLKLERDNNAEALMALGTAEVKMGAYKEAIKTYQKAIRLEPHNINALHNLALLHRHLGDTAGAERFSALARDARTGIKNPVTATRP